MASITVLKENVPAGPFTRAEVAEKLRTGEFSLESLAFVEGLAQWTPLRDVLARVDSAAPVVAAAAPAASTPYSYAATMQPPGHLVYAGFWLRFAAHLVDMFLILAGAMILAFGIGLVTGIFMALMGHSEDRTMILVPVKVFVFTLTVILQWLYFALMESGPGQATLGKRLLDIYVTDTQGNRISFKRPTGRYFGKILSGLTIYIGYMMAGWTPRKQALHDMLADTLVVRK
jgi:uncharacterized RDD family membrane protein YckC